MEERKFKVGDRVRATNDDAWGDVTGKIGTVIAVLDIGTNIVEFDENLDAHDGKHGSFEGGKFGHCIYINDESIELYNENPKSADKPEEVKPEEPNPKFKVGDRVKCKGIDFCESRTTDKLGTIICIDRELDGKPGRDYGVEFDENVNGHSCGGVGRGEHCFWATEKEIELVSEKPVETDTKPAPTKIIKFLFVEDGSVDADELINDLAVSNPEIKVIVYRQGSQMPKLVEVYDE